MRGKCSLPSGDLSTPKAQLISWLIKLNDLRVIRVDKSSLFFGMLERSCNVFNSPVEQVYEPSTAVQACANHRHPHRRR